MNSFASDLFAVLKSRVTVIACGVGTSIITARYLGPAANGLVASLIVYPDLFMVVGALGIRQSAAYFVGQKKFTDEEVFSSILSVWTLSSVFCVLSCFILIWLLLDTTTTTERIYVFLSLLPLPFSLFSTYLSGFFLGKNQIKQFNTVNWAPNVIKLISYLFLIVLIPLNVYGALIGRALSYIVLFFLLIFKVRKIVAVKWQVIPEIIKKMLSLGIIYAVSLLITTLNYKFDIVLLNSLSTKYEIGIYTKGVSIVEYIWEIPTLISTIIFARSANSSEPEQFSIKVAQLLRVCMVVITICSVIFFFCSEWMMVLLYGEQFRYSSVVQKILLPGILLMTIFKVLYMDLAGKGKPVVAIWAMLPSLFINIILNFMWDKKYGAAGSAMASTVSYSISAVIFLLMYSKVAKMSLKQILYYSKSDFNFIPALINKYRNKKIMQ